MEALSENFAYGVVRTCLKRGLPTKAAAAILFRAQTQRAGAAAIAGMRKEAGKLAPLLYVGQEDGGLPLAAREARAGLIKAAQQRLREIDAQLSSPASSDTLRMSLALQRNALQSDLNEVITGS